MQIKWSKGAVNQLLDAIQYLEDDDSLPYATKLESKILSKIELLSQNSTIHQADRLKKNNDGTFHAIEIDSYRISFRVLKNELRILRIRHSSRRQFTR